MGLLLVFAAALLAFALSTVSGGGAGLLLLPVLARVLPASVVPAALTVGTATSTASKLGLFWRHINWSIARRFVPGAVPGVLLGAYLLKYLNPLYLEVVIGLFLLSNLTMLWRKDAAVAEPAVAASGLKLGALGFLAGFLSGLTGAVGLLFNKFYFRYGLSRDAVIATRAANELLLHFIKLALYLWLGLLTTAAWQAGATVAVGAVMATAGTKRLVRYLPEQAFRRIGYAAMVLSGAFMLSSAGAELRETKNLRASAALLGDDLEITGWWHSGSLTLELELDESPAIEQPVALADLPPDVQAAIVRLQQGRPILKIEEVWKLHTHYYELYLNDGGRVRSLNVPH
ncbi:sulfite exporter TauE/SafE family protein [Hymenobacter properus]|uniref:Probable membrane transporter protein n=1 Tax=Hymenobacter properus TaxID=2791026 RepID=A0A931FLS2_9BACT|nr:sulfite exporter TauE/SafE family protein [Hymenobacter properus]MBF9144538.1 sulfite exporter TauE/SafE family protein [Hymenobacter properus]MBR7723356.1 sulfite exporter TauE/SafE family protein [Microvirga sp. SRT04]